MTLFVGVVVGVVGVGIGDSRSWMNKWSYELVKNFKSGMCVMPVKYSLARRDKIDWVITHYALLKPSNRGKVEKFPMLVKF